MKTVGIPEDYQHISPAGAEVRILMSNNHGGIAHCTLKNKKFLKQFGIKRSANFGIFYPGKELFGGETTLVNPLFHLKRGSPSTFLWVQISNIEVMREI